MLLFKMKLEWPSLQMPTYVFVCVCVSMFMHVHYVCKDSLPLEAVDEASVALTRCTAVMNTFESFHSMCAWYVAKECDQMELHVPQMPKGRSGPVTVGLGMQAFAMSSFRSFSWK